MAAPGSLSLAVVFSVLLIVVNGVEDLYRELGVSRSAGTQEIRTAFRRLAKEWHPDKNKSPLAKEKFIKLNQAYEILTDDEKRRKYDHTGEIGDSPQQRQPFSGQGFTVFQFQGGNTFHFRFNTGGRSQRNDGVTTTSFFDDVLPNSHHKPYLLNFYHDFCFQCGQMQQLWNQLKRELQSLGIGLGSVHTNFHPRVAQYCSVSRVPSVVGVVSGRVVHLHGQIRDVRSIVKFLEGILPSEIVQTLTEANMDSFLSDALVRNKPRLVLFTLDPEPTLTHKLMAFANQKRIDVGHASTHPRKWSREVLSRFEVHLGERQLAHLYKEDYRPVEIIEDFELSEGRLKTLLETATLYLPRLSSQKMLNRVCPLDGSSRLCVVLLVQDSSSYNDSTTRLFREVAKRGTYNHSPRLQLSFSYLDTTKQSKFLENFHLAAVSLKPCYDGGKARPVLLLIRMSSQLIWFDWYDQFCGEYEDDYRLEDFLSSFSPNKLEKSATVPHLHDEDAPGWFGQLVNDVLQFYIDVYDYLLAIDPQILTPTVTLLCATVLLCLVGLLAGGPQDSEDNRAQRARNSPPRSHSPAHQESSGQIYPLNQKAYIDLVQSGPRGQLTVVLLVDSTQKEKNKLLAHTFWKTAIKFLTRRVYVCYVCYRGRERWLERLLKASIQIPPSEVEARVSCCSSGQVATIVALFGSRKQLSIFPESIATLSMSTGSVVANGGVESDHVIHKQEQVRRNTSSQKSVGTVLASTLGFDEPEQDEESDEEIRYSFKQRHKDEKKKKKERRDDSQTKDSLSEPTKSQQEESTSRRKIHSVADQDSVSNIVSGDVGSCVDPRVVQLSKQLEVWMERLADGSLRRYTLEVWPEWDELTQ